MPDPSSISRRESLTRIAGALTVGLAAPAALAANDPARSHWRVEFFDDADGRPVASVTLPHEVTDRLLDNGLLTLERVTFVNVQAETRQSFRTRPER